MKSAISTAANWVENNIIQPIKGFVSDIATDIENYDKNNTNEKAVLESNYFSAYKGATVIRFPYDDNAASYGLLFIGKGVEDIETVQHEYGHYRQLEELDYAKYTVYVAIPSLIGYWSDVENYYSQPWEYGADLYGGVDRGDYHVYANYAYYIYWDWITQ